jgi:hypothetical protein
MLLSCFPQFWASTVIGLVSTTRLESLNASATSPDTVEANVKATSLESYGMAVAFIDIGVKDMQTTIF